MSGISLKSSTVTVNERRTSSFSGVLGRKNGRETGKNRELGDRLDGDEDDGGDLRARREGDPVARSNRASSSALRESPSF
jgi:hypothetical protein